MPKGLFLLNERAYHMIYGEVQPQIDDLIEVIAEPQTAESVTPDLLAEAELIFSGWGMVPMDEDFLAQTPNLKAVFYGAGSIKSIATPAFWQRDILITHSAMANAIPVAEYTLSQIFFCLKGGWHYALRLKREGQWFRGDFPYAGGYGSTVGIISLGLIGRRVCELLQPFNLRVIAYDPFVDDDLAAELGVEMVSLEDLFKQSDVVSLHTPWLKETEGMINGDLFASMKPHAAFINTARGAVVDEPAMIAVLQEREDLFAVLDVTYPEPPEPESPLFTLPNIVLTPHIAGALGTGEGRRLGETMLAELRRYLNGEPLQWAINQERFERMA